MVLDDPIVGKIGKGKNGRGAHSQNFARSVRLAVLDSQSKLNELKSSLIEIVGEQETNLIMCAILKDNPIEDCDTKEITKIVLSNPTYNRIVRPNPHICCEHFKVKFDFEADGPLRNDWSNDIIDSGRNLVRPGFILVNKEVFFPEYVPGAFGTYVNEYGTWGMTSEDGGFTGVIEIGLSVHTGAQANKKQEHLSYNFSFQPQVNADGKRVYGNALDVEIKFSD